VKKRFHRYNLRDEYYDIGHGVNEAEALRQDLVVDLYSLYSKIISLKIEEIMGILDKTDRLANLAGAKAYRRWLRRTR